MGVLDPVSVIMMFAMSMGMIVGAGAFGYFAWGASYKASFFMQMLTFGLLILLLPGIFGVV